jgi:hypothetical protein
VPAQANYRGAVRKVNRRLEVAVTVTRKKATPQGGKVARMFAAAAGGRRATGTWTGTWLGGALHPADQRRQLLYDSIGCGGIHPVSSPRQRPADIPGICHVDKAFRRAQTQHSEHGRYRGDYDPHHAHQSTLVECIGKRGVEPIRRQP